jgi:hypothetical protein
MSSALSSSTMAFKNVTFLRVTPQRVAAARDWLLDCFPNDEDDIVEASDRTIVRETQRHFGGGWDQFVVAGCDVD